MCGIAGLFSYNSNAMPVDRDDLIAIDISQISRGMDGNGLWESPDRRVAFAHRRLAIIDLSEAAAQPMVAAESGEVITFNGEIYNFHELRRDLEKEGVSFRTNSDTELLLALYRRHGELMLDMVQGMYAFAIWDPLRRELFAARDPFGIKPFYFIDDGQIIRFASQVKALVNSNGIRLTPNPAGHVAFFLFGFIPDPHTLYHQIKALPAGHCLRVREGGRLELKCYYDASLRIAEASENSRFISPHEQEDIVRAALSESISRHLVADVPVGVFLSAGIDSNVIAANAARQAGAGAISTVTLGFDEFRGTLHDEVPVAEAQAIKLGTLHNTTLIRKDEFYEHLRAIWASMDQPSVDGINCWLVSRAASEAGLKVCLSGIGGDELFGGYPSFQQVPRLTKLISQFPIPSFFRSVYREVFRHMPELLLSPKVSGILDYGKTIGGSYLLRRGLFLPEEVNQFMDVSMIKEGLRTLEPLLHLEMLGSGIAGNHGKIVSMELCWYMRHQLLRDADWASMAHGLELRTPFVDRGFFESVLPTIVAPNPSTKITLLNCIPEVLSKNIRERRKTGFATPVRQWLNGRYTKSTSDRGLRGWSRIVYSEFVPELSLTPSDPIPPYLTERKPIVVFRIGQLGDTLISLPALQSIRTQFPDDRLVLLTDQHPTQGHYVSSWDVLGPTGLFDHVILYPKLLGQWENLWTYVMLASRLRKLAPKRIINLAPRVREKERLRDRLFFQILVGANRYLALPVSGSADGSLRSSIASTREWQRLFDAVTNGQSAKNYNLPLPKWAISEAKRALNNVAGVGAILVAVAPGSKMPAKRWRRNRFQALGTQILSEYSSAMLVVIGGNEDAELGDLLCSSWGNRSLNLAGKLSIFGSAAVLKQCSTYIGNDSGAMHLAALVGTPCVAIFSARDTPGKWDPYGDNHQVLRQEIDCAGCMVEICNRGNECLERVSVKLVMDAVRDVLSIRT